MYSIFADEAAHYARLPDSISGISCHLGWAVNANKLIMTVLQTWCCCLWGVLAHIHTTNKLLFWRIQCVVDAALYKFNLLRLPVSKKKKMLNCMSCGVLDNKTLWCTDVRLVCLILSNNRTYHSKTASRLVSFFALLLYRNKVVGLIPGDLWSCMFSLPLH